MTGRLDESSPPYLAVTQGDPAGVGPELLLRLVAAPPREGEWRPLLVAERVALDSARASVGTSCRLHYFDSLPEPRRLAALEPDLVPVLDPVGARRQVVPGESGPSDAAGAVASLDAGIALARRGVVRALITAPVSKESIARHAIPGFRGHTEYLAGACGLERYGRDYLMAFLGPDLQVALLTTHLPLTRAVEAIGPQLLGDALSLLDRLVGGRIAVAGLNPHAGEGGLLGEEEERWIAPAVRRARRWRIDAHGPYSADSLFARARRGEFDWVLALYHDQGLIAVKTASFGSAVNWTLGLPFLRTSVDQGTAFDLAGRGVADVEPLRRVVEATLDLVAGRLPRSDRRDGDGDVGGR